MALFFDAAWFDAALASASRTRAELAAALSIGDLELAEIFKDQRELSAEDVRRMAAFLGRPPEEVAERAGISTPRPSLGWSSAAERAGLRKSGDAPPAGEAAASIALRLERIERRLESIEALLAALAWRPTA